MKKQDHIKIEGFVRLQVKDSIGNLLQDTGFQKNGITNVALAAFSGLIGNTGSQTAFTYLAVGTGTTAFAASQTTLVTEITDTGLARAAATISRSTTTQTADTLQLDYTWTATGTKTIGEVGVFNAASVGVMAARKVPTAVTVVNTQTLLVTYKIVFT